MSTLPFSHAVLIGIMCGVAGCGLLLGWVACMLWFGLPSVDPAEPASWMPGWYRPRHAADDDELP